MGQVEDAASQRLGEPVLAAGMVLPVAGWNSGLVGQTARRILGPLRGQAASTVRLDRYNVIAVTESQVRCFSAGFARGEGVVLNDELASLPREGLTVDAEKIEVTTAHMRDSSTRSSSKRVQRLAVTSGDQVLRADVSDDAPGRKLIKALRGG